MEPAASNANIKNPSSSRDIRRSTAAITDKRKSRWNDFADLYRAMNGVNTCPPTDGISRRSRSGVLQLLPDEFDTFTVYAKIGTSQAGRRTHVNHPCNWINPELGIINVFH